MRIVAFMQNPWFPPNTAERHIIAYRDNQEFHRRLLANTMSGRRLVTAFGDLFRKIHWDNTNWRPAWMPCGKVPADMGHISGVLEAKMPHLVLCFGNQAKEALAATDWDPKLVMTCHHPNARFKTQDDLNLFAASVGLRGLAIELKENDARLSTH